MVTPHQALMNLAQVQREVTQYRIQYEQALANERSAFAALERVQERFDVARDIAIEACPALLTGYANHETVKVIDGKIKVVEE